MRDSNKISSKNKQFFETLKNCLFALENTYNLFLKLTLVSYSLPFFIYNGQTIDLKYHENTSLKMSMKLGNNKNA